jgi:transposase
MFAVEVYAAVRCFVFVEGHSRREAARVFGLSRETVLKMCRFSLPPGYTRTAPVAKPKLGALLPVIDTIMETDRAGPVKQRHTAKRIFERLRDEHDFSGGYTVVKDYVRLCRARGRETFVPLAHPPGHGQVDFGEAIAVIGGVRQKIHFFCMDLPQSDACFVKAYPRETTEAFLDGHVSAFAFFGGVPLSLLYDNTTIAVARICGDGKRERTRAFTELVSHYLFADRFGRPGKGNDKGKVEGLVKYARANFMVPIPEAASFDDLNATLAMRCRARQGEHAGRHAETIGARLVADIAALCDLPAVPLEPCEKRAARVSSTALVRYRCNDYSVPTRYGFQEVMVKGFVDAVVILCGGKIVARHPRSYAEGAFVADPLHYLALIEMKPNALDQAAALQDWDLPEVFQHLRHRLEARMGNKGKREFIQVLRLLEAMPKDVVTDAVTQAIHLGAIGFDAVKLIALARIERRPARLDLAAYPHLPRLTVQTTRAADYAALVPGMAA